MDHQRFTSQYVEIIEDVLNIETSSNGEVKYRWSSNVPRELSRRLENHFNTHSESAISSARAEAQEQRISFHYGFSPNLNETLKYAPLYTDHVVLQDIVYRTARREHTNSSVRDSILRYVGNIIKWKPLIEEGYVSILPSPHLWSSEIRNFMDSIDTEPRKICTQPLWAAGHFNATPFTDSRQYQNHTFEIVEDARRIQATSATGQVIKDPTAARALDLGVQSRDGDGLKYTEVDGELRQLSVLSVGSQLFGKQDEKDDADLFYVTDADYEEVIELAQEFEGFRSKFQEILEDIAQNDGDEVHEIVEKCPERIESDYEDIKREMNLKRKATLGTAGIAGLTMSLPVILNLSPRSLVSTTHLVNNFETVEQLLTAVVGIAGGVSGFNDISEVANKISSDEYDFVRVMDSFEQNGIHNSPIECLTPTGY